MKATKPTIAALQATISNIRRELWAACDRANEATEQARHWQERATALMLENELNFRARCERARQNKRWYQFWK